MYIMKTMMSSVFGTIIRYNVLMIINRRGTNYHQNYNRVLKCFADASMGLELVLRLILKRTKIMCLRKY